MPAESRIKQLVLALLSTAKKPLSSSQIALSLGKTGKNQINLVSHRLLELWKKGLIVRSEREIGLEYHYFFGNKELETTIYGTKIRLSAYNEKFRSRDLKKRIIEIVKAHGPLTVKEVCAKLKPDFDLPFLKKINFHLQDLYIKKQVLRSSKPYQYYADKKDQRKISTQKASVPTRLFHLLDEKKTALFTSELVRELESRGNKPKLSTVSLALKRLCRQQKIFSNKVQFGTRGSKTGYLWACSQEAVRQRFWKELPANVKELLAQDEVSAAALGSALKISSAAASRWLSRISAELPEFVVEFADDERKQSILRKRNNAS